MLRDTKATIFIKKVNISLSLSLPIFKARNISTKNFDSILQILVWFNIYPQRVAPNKMRTEKQHYIIAWTRIQ
jgi:hypothetical protein